MLKVDHGTWNHCWNGGGVPFGLLLVACLLLTGVGHAASPAWQQKIDRYTQDGSIMAWNEQGAVLFERRPDARRIPASILKLAISCAAMEHWGEFHRFTTEFYRTVEQDLVIRGLGDPFLVSEEWQRIARKVAALGVTGIRDIMLDASYFSPDLEIDGLGSTTNPFDAINCALSTNFNTINVRISADGTISSAEPQTPLIPMMKEQVRMRRIRSSQRFTLRHDRAAVLRLTGEIAAWFLRAEGIEVAGSIREGQVPDTAALLYRHSSGRVLGEVLAGMLEYSNNFTANQLLLILGAETYGAPATIDKGRRALNGFLTRTVGWKDAQIEEASGISRKNRVSARQFGSLLKRFRPFRDLLVEKDGVQFKTGTLSDVKSLCGYFPGPDNSTIAFVILLSGPNRNRERILTQLRIGLGAGRKAP